MRPYSSFYQKVWKVIKKIPPGKVQTYKWVAKKLGNEHLARLVGQALKANPYAPRIPCHRVIKSDRTLGGYSKGINKKIKLLQKEGIKIERIANSKQRIVKFKVKPT